MMRVRIRSGEGVVVRRGHVVAVVRGDDALIDELLDVIDTAEAHLVGPELLRLVRRTTDPGCALAAVIVGPESDAIIVGAARCEVDADGESPVSVAGPAPQLVGLNSPPRTVVLTLDGAGAAIPRSDLVDGVTVGAGAEVDVTGAGADGAARHGDDRDPSTGAVAAVAAPVVVAPGVALPPPPLPSSAPPPPEPSVPEPPPVNLLVDLPDDEPDAASVVLEPLPATPDEMPAGDDVVMVRGVACSIGHVNRLDAIYCSSCGRRLQQTVKLTEGPRPPLGTLIFDDGAAFGLDRGYVIGREPGTEPSVVAGQNGSIVLDDADRSISRIHAEIRLIEWDVVVVDRGSANGTFVFPPGGTAWSPLQADVPVTIGDGWSVAVGRRTFVYQQR